MITKFDWGEEPKPFDSEVPVKWSEAADPTADVSTARPKGLTFSLTGWATKGVDITFMPIVFENPLAGKFVVVPYDEWVRFMDDVCRREMPDGVSWRGVFVRYKRWAAANPRS